MEMQEFEKRLLASAAWGLFTRRVVVPWALRFADLPAAGDVLVVGSGRGSDAETMLEAFPGWRMTASDFDPDMVEMAAGRLARFGDRVHVERADATALHHPDHSFDVVVSFGVWHHVGRWERALVECARVLRPSGLLLLVDLLEPFFTGPIGGLFPPARAYSMGELLAALAEARFARYRLSRTPLWYRLLAQTTP